MGREAPEIEGGRGAGGAGSHATGTGRDVWADGEWQETGTGIVTVRMML